MTVLAGAVRPSRHRGPHGGTTLTRIMQQSESLAVEWRPIDSVRPYPGNPRIITDDDVSRLSASIKKFGWRQPIVVDADGVIVVGHTRLRAAKKLGLEVIPVHVAEGLSAEAIRAYRLADNRTGESTRWDMPALKLELEALQPFDTGLDGMGFGEPDIESLFADLVQDEGEEIKDDDRGSLLKLVNVAIAEPKHQVEKGDHYLISDRHHLLCVGVMSDWPRWAPLLKVGSIFCPYPGPFVPYGKKADEHALILVQPDPYTAGHLLDRYAEIHGADAVSRVAA